MNNIIIPRVNSQTKKNDAPGKSGQFIPLNTIRYMFRFDMDTNNNTNSITEEMDENGDVVLNTEGLAENVNESDSQQNLFTQEQSTVETNEVEWARTSDNSYEVSSQSSTNNIISSNEINELSELGKQRKNECK